VNSGFDQKNSYVLDVSRNSDEKISKIHLEQKDRHTERVIPAMQIEIKCKINKCNWNCKISEVNNIDVYLRLIWQQKSSYWA